MSEAPRSHALAISALVGDTLPPTDPGTSTGPEANSVRGPATTGEYATAHQAYLARQDAHLRAAAEWDTERTGPRLAARLAEDRTRYDARLATFEALAYAALRSRAASRVLRQQSEADAEGREETVPKNRRKRKAEAGLISGTTKFRVVIGEPGAARPKARPKTRARDDDAAPTVRGGTREAKGAKKAQGTPKQYQTTYEGIWREIARKEVPKAFKLYQGANAVKQANAKKTAVLASKEARRWDFRTNKLIKDMQTRARRAMREMMTFWKRNEKEERDMRRRAEKEALESARRQEEERESRRQARKLNFLITQTELYSHFVGSKIKTDELEDSADTADSSGTGSGRASGAVSSAASVLENAVDDYGGDHRLTAVGELDFDAAEDDDLARAAQANAHKAVLSARARAHEFDEQAVRNIEIDDEEMNFQNPTSLGDISIPQPKMLTAKLKEYQLKGLNWLANLYEQGINGILADEMGLGKTVQSISVMAYLAETHDIWGPYLVIAPASTLHNWQQEITKFVPEFKVLPYWGNNKDRKVLRKFWDRKQLRYTRDSPFHVLVTSYQLVVADAQYFNRIKWQYMILDEAQAIKSSSSSRWKSLLSMQCRNRLLLTGTPIQNSMQELWALLHFIMPTLFDSHEEFSDWFSKDIESHATKNSKLNEQQLKRLHMILKPFMLRRIKKNVQQELGDKIEVDVYCNLTRRQRKLYQILRSQISLRDLLEKTANDDTQSLMNLVMQFRKVCNHPDLFEREDVKSPLAFGTFGQTVDYSREGNMLSLTSSLRNEITFDFPKRGYREGLVLDVPSEGSDVFLRRKLAHQLSVWDPQNSTIQAAANLEGTGAGEICSLARKGLLERALESYDAEKLFMFAEKKPEHLSIIENFSIGNHGLAKKAFFERVTAAPISLVGPDRSLTVDQESVLFTPALKSFVPLSLDQEWSIISKGGIKALPPSNLYPEVSPAGHSNIEIPSMSRFLTDSGKLSKLDSLLAELKREDHRVLIYFQMTKMMDLVEEYLTYRQYRYIRLDGSSKLSDRRDLVNDWQTKPEIFVFLLSTRAGGLGINLTAADTVIFYDSDWNPTIDSQAMDRAHRLGQQRQVTVYRLLVRGTIEERMRDRAKQKEHVQQVVMEGRGQQADFQSSGREVAYWLLDDESAVSEAIHRQEQAHSVRKAKKRGRKPAKGGDETPKIEDLYHEQEGNFDSK